MDSSRAGNLHLPVEEPRAALGELSIPRSDEPSCFRAGCTQPHIDIREETISSATSNPGKILRILRQVVLLFTSDPPMRARSLGCPGIEVLTHDHEILGKDYGGSCPLQAKGQVHREKTQSLLIGSGTPRTPRGSRTRQKRHFFPEGSRAALLRVSEITIRCYRVLRAVANLADFAVVTLRAWPSGYERMRAGYDSGMVKASWHARSPLARSAKSLKTVIC